jgi:hypothetical protein
MKKHEYCKTCIADKDCPHQRLNEAEYCEVDGVGEWYPSPTVVQQRLSAEPSDIKTADSVKRCTKLPMPFYHCGIKTSDNTEAQTG